MVSIIVPVYNAEAYIADTIRMVVQQTYADWELLLVDDASTDGSVRAIQTCMDSLPGSDIRRKEDRIRLICKRKNEGAARARNTGLDAAKGRYIAFLDADDIWRPQKLARELEFMEREEAGFVFTAYDYGDENGTPTGKAVRVPRMLTYKEALPRTVIFTSTVLIDTDKIDKELLRMPDIGSEDTATWWNILRSGHTAHGLNELLVIYRRPKGASLSSDKCVAVRRIWRLYRHSEGLSLPASLWYLAGWAIRAAWRRTVPARRERLQ